MGRRPRDPTAFCIPRRIPAAAAAGTAGRNIIERDWRADLGTAPAIRVETATADGTAPQVVAAAEAAVLAVAVGADRIAERTVAIAG